MKINAEYGLSFGAYWMIFAVIGSFASVFMLAKGYTNTHIGMTLAAANLISIGMQPFIADHMDRSKGIQIIDVLGMFTVLLMIIGVGLFVFSGGTVMLAATLAILIGIHTMLQPLLIGFALILPAMVYFVDEIMSPGEAVKGQSLFTMMITLATIASSLIGGWILDTSGVKALTGVVSLITAAGALIIIMSIDKIQSHS